MSASLSQTYRVYSLVYKRGLNSVQFFRPHARASLARLPSSHLLRRMFDIPPCPRCPRAPVPRVFPIGGAPPPGPSPSPFPAGVSPLRIPIPETPSFQGSMIDLIYLIHLISPRTPRTPPCLPLTTLPSTYSSNCYSSGYPPNLPTART